MATLRRRRSPLRRGLDDDRARRKYSRATGTVVGARPRTAHRRADRSAGRMSSIAALERGLQAHILDGDQAIALGIDSSEQVSAATRLKIYSDAYRLRLIEALQANFPIIEQLLGPDEFGRLT